MITRLLYYEKLSSLKTLLLFTGLSLLFLALFIWRLTARSLDLLGFVLLFLFFSFLFYSFNYRTLIIELSSEALKLSFGIFSWKIALTNISSIQVDDDLPWLAKYGGAGIHFMMIGKRYRAFLNFLEYPRVVVRLKRKAGPVKDISFSTRQPVELIRLVQSAIPPSNATNSRMVALN